jgi:hypothetical protein
MRDRRPARSLWGAAVLLLAGCDSTVGLDSQRLSFSRVLVPGACKAPGSDDLSNVEMSVMLLDEDSALLPDDRISGESGRVGDLLTFDDFRFVENPVGTDPGELMGKPGLAENDAETEGQDRVRLPVGLQPDNLKFLWSGGEERRDDNRLVVLLMDQSGSLIGLDPITSMVDTNRASDIRDQRIVFFKDFVSELPDNDYVSLVPFNGEFVVTADSAPTKNRDVILEGLDQLDINQPSGGTPLARALDASLTSIIDFAGNADLNPVVVLFTDGTESGDTSPEGTTLDTVTEKFANHTRTVDGERVPAPIPVIVVHLQVPASAAVAPLSWPRGHDAKYADLACRTGGEYIFLRDAGEFTANGNLPTILRNRVVGTWRLNVQSGLGQGEFTPGGYLLTSELSVTLGGNTASAPMALSRDVNAQTQDTRLWFYKK